MADHDHKTPQRLCVRGVQNSSYFMPTYEIIQTECGRNAEWVIMAIYDDGLREHLSKHRTELEAQLELKWLFAQLLAPGSG